MALEDEDFDLLAGGEADDDAAADSVSELDTGDEATDADADISGSVAEQAAEDVSGDQASGKQSEAESQGNEETQQGQQVPLAVLLDERKTFQSRLDEMNQKLGKFESLQERIDRIQAEKAEEQKQPEPDYLDDPKAYVDHKTEQARQAAEQTRENVTQLQQSQQMQEQMRQVNDRLSQYDTAFVKAGNEDYFEAMDHVRQINVENFKALGASEEQAESQAGQAILMAQINAMKQGVNPAEYMYNMATRFGYSRAEPDPGKADLGTEGDDAIIAGQQAQGMGGGTAPTAEETDELTDDEFEAAFRETWGMDAH